MDLSNKNIGEIVLYQPDETVRLEVRVEVDTVWLSQAQMGILFGRDRTVIGRHIRNIFTEGELQEDEVCAKFAHTTQHGAISGKTQTSDIQYYNLDLIISVGFRVKSHKGIAFRRWATKVLKEYLLKGFVINQRIEQVERIVVEIKQMVESIAVEANKRVTETEKKIEFLTQYIEDILSDNNDINEDTQAQLEAISQMLAELQAKTKWLDNPGKPHWN